MDADQVRAHIEALMRDDITSKEGMPHLAALLSEFFVTQARIAAALERLAAKAEEQKT